MKDINSIPIELAVRI